MRRNIYTVAAGFIALFVCAGIAIADPQALPANILNGNGALINTAVSVPSGNPTYPISFSFGSGGGFSATIDGYSTVMWCVDAEEDISPPTDYSADLVQVSQIAANSNDVRYGNVTNWQNNGPAPDYTNYTAEQRYEMAAYLIDTYYSPLPNGPNPSNTLQSRSVQTAIWELLWNDTSSDGLSYSQVSGDGSSPGTYVTAAENFVAANPNSSIFDDYAVVSGGLTYGGGLKSPGVQTYLVQLTSPSPVPEPASVILFASLLIAVFALRRRARGKRADKVCESPSDVYVG